MELAPLGSQLNSKKVFILEPSVPPLRFVEMMEGPTRPSTVEVMILVNVIGAISILIFGSLVGANQLPLIGSSIGSSYYWVLILLVALILLSDIGLWVGQKWGIALTILSIAIYFASLVMFVNVLGLIVGILLLYYLTRPLVKEWLMTSKVALTTTPTS